MRYLRRNVVSIWGIGEDEWCRDDLSISSFEILWKEKMTIWNKTEWVSIDEFVYVIIPLFLNTLHCQWREKNSMNKVKRGPVRKQLWIGKGNSLFLCQPKFLASSLLLSMFFFVCLHISISSSIAIYYASRHSLSVLSVSCLSVVITQMESYPLEHLSYILYSLSAWRGHRL